MYANGGAFYRSLFLKINVYYFKETFFSAMFVKALEYI